MKYTVPFILIFSVFLFSCEKNNDFNPTIINEKTNVFASGELREAGQNSFAPFRIEIGKTNEELEYIFWHGDFSEGELGGTLIAGAYPTELWNTTPLFGLQFWSDVLPGNRNWTSAELDTFFAPGTTFAFGQGPGKVELFLHLPIGGPYDGKPSRPSFLASPQGSLTITAIEDYDFFINPYSNGHSYGKLIRCTFAGQLGRYNSLADQADGNPNFFQTDEVVELQNGEAVFYVEYERE